MPLRAGDTLVTSAITGSALVACWTATAWAQGPAPEIVAAATSAALPSDVAVMIEMVRLLGAPGVALALGWALARWRPVLTLVVRHDIPEGSRLEVVSVERRPQRPDGEEDTGTVRLRTREDRG